MRVPMLHSYYDAIAAIALLRVVNSKTITLLFQDHTLIKAHTEIHRTGAGQQRKKISHAVQHHLERAGVCCSKRQRTV